MDKNKKCCGNCARFVRDDRVPGRGWCDEWAGVLLAEDDVCHPYIGRPWKNGKATIDEARLRADYEQSVLDKRRFVTWVELNGRVVPKECLAKMELKIGMAEEAISHFGKVARQHGIELTEPEVEE